MLGLIFGLILINKWRNVEFHFIYIYNIFMCQINITLHCNNLCCCPTLQWRTRCLWRWLAFFFVNSWGRPPLARVGMTWHPTQKMMQPDDFNNYMWHVKSKHETTRRMPFQNVIISNCLTLSIPLGVSYNLLLPPFPVYSSLTHIFHFLLLYASSSICLSIISHAHMHMHRHSACASGTDSLSQTNTHTHTHTHTHTNTHTQKHIPTKKCRQTSIHTFSICLD